MTSRWSVWYRHQQFRVCQVDEAERPSPVEVIPTKEPEVECTSIAMAIKHDNMIALRELVEEGGADLKQETSDGDLPLDLAIKYKSLAAIKELVALGADVNQENSTTMRPIDSAIRYNYVPAIKQLVSLGAELNQENSQEFSPITVAIFYEHTEALRELVKHGADINLEDAEGIRPFDYACINMKYKSVKECVTLGVDTNRENSAGVAPLDLALQNGQVSVARYLFKKCNVDQKSVSSLETICRMYLAMSLPGVKIKKLPLPDEMIIKICQFSRYAVNIISHCSSGELALFELIKCENIGEFWRSIMSYVGLPAKLVSVCEEDSDETSCRLYRAIVRLKWWQGILPSGGQVNKILEAVGIDTDRAFKSGGLWRRDK